MRPWHAFGVGVCLLVSLACHGARNNPPYIVPIPDVSAVVGNTLVIEIFAQDPDGDQVTLSVSGAPDGARLFPTQPGHWLFEYTPMAFQAAPGGRKYTLAFVASDDRGGSTQEQCELTVWLEALVPVFVGPFAWAINLARENHVAALVKVRDDDSTDVNLRLVRGPQGARLNKYDGRSAMFFFRPSPSQIKPTAVLTFTIGASDHDHPEVLQDFLVVLVNGERFEGCPGKVPITHHKGIFDQYGPGPYWVELFAYDPDSVVREVTLCWSTKAGLDEDKTNKVRLEAQGVGVYRGAIPGQIAGNGQLVYYHFHVYDDDDLTGDYCDHEVRYPPKGEFAFAAYGPGFTGCLDDDEQEEERVLSQDKAGLRICGVSEDFFVDLFGGWLAVEARLMSAGSPLMIEVLDPFGTILASGIESVFTETGTPGTYSVRVLNVSGKPITYALRSATGWNPCINDPYEPNGPPSPPRPLGPGIYSAILCPADRDNYEVFLEQGQALAVTLQPEDPKAQIEFVISNKGLEAPLQIAPYFGPKRRLVYEASQPVTAVISLVAMDMKSVRYELALEVASQAQLCDEDLFGFVSTPEEAPFLPEGARDNLKLCPGRYDFFRIGLNGRETLWAAAEAKSSGQVLPLALLDGKNVLAEGEGVRARTSTVVPGPGTILLRVGPVRDTAVQYRLAFGTIEPQDCAPDRLEPNDTPDNASALASGFTTHLTLCKGDRDLFSLRLNAFEVLYAALFFRSAAGHMILRDQEGQTLADGQAVEFGEELVYVADSPKTVYLEVGFVNSAGWYDLWASKD